MKLLQKYNKVNVGANIYDAKPGWLNISLLETFMSKCSLDRVEDGIGIYKYPYNDAEFIGCDVAEGLPFPDNSLDGVYSSHFIEHLDFEVALTYIKEAYRVLKPGGVMRTICPDLGVWISKLISSDDSFFSTYRELIQNNWHSNKVKGVADKITTNSQIFNSMIYNWGHKWMWDEESLFKEMSDAGFISISNTGHGLSSLVGSNELETNSNPSIDKSRRLESIYIDALK